MGSFSVALSGLDTSTEDLSVIANDLANMNTVGYKSTNANFQDLFYQQVGTSANGDPEQVGAGVQIGSVSTEFNQGGTQSTGVASDVSIQGQGFFVVNNNGIQQYTRAGNFTVASNGQLTTTDGGQVMGYPATNGVVNANASISPLTIPTGLTIAPKASTQFTIALALNSGSSAPVSAASQQTGSGIAAATTLATGGTFDFTDGTNAFTYSSAAGDTMNTLATAINANPNFTATVNGGSLVVAAKNGQPVNISANTLTDAATSTQAETFAATGTAVPAGTFSTPVTVFDALGASHVLTANFTKTAPNTWNYTLTIPAADLGQTGAPVSVKSGTFTFDGSGKFISPPSPIDVQINGLADGATNLTVNWNLADPNGNALVTQVAIPSAASSTQTDGYSAGSLQSYSVASDGTIQGVFSNNQTLALGQIALASFTNLQGLQQNGANNYVASLASGQPNVGKPNTGGLGTITGGALEQSNVDIATEFSKLILAQRGYQANAQTVTTLDQVSQYAINMIQNG